MKTAAQVAEIIEQVRKDMREERITASLAAWRVALACVGWPYLYGDRGEYCTPAQRRAVWASHAAEQPKLREQCKNFDGGGSCSGCKWYPGGQRVRSFDCRGFTYWILLQIYGWKLMGGGCTSQWNNEENWKMKGTVAEGIPQDVIVCLFYYKKDKSGKRTSTVAHTGLYYNGETCECSSGVQHKAEPDQKWEMWGVPACETGDIPTPVPPDPDKKPTLRKGDQGAFVTLAQTELIQRGYDLGSWGADGKFGNATEKAVKAFQRDWDLAQDGIIGPKTWAMLESTPERVTYRVTVGGLGIGEAEALKAQYPRATLEREGGD